jgi:hypothetical protein
MFSRLSSNSSAVRSFTTKLKNQFYGYPGGGTIQGFTGPTLAPNGLSYSVWAGAASGNPTWLPILVMDPKTVNGRNANGSLTSWEDSKSYLVSDNYTNRPDFARSPGGSPSDANFNVKGVLAPNGLIYFTLGSGYIGAFAGQTLLVLNPGTGLVPCTGAQGTISGTTLTITVAPTSGSFGVGQTITGAGIPGNVTITSFTTGRGGIGTYVISTSLTIGTAISIDGSPFPDCTWEILPSTSTWVATRFGGSKFLGGVLASDNNIYLVPGRGIAPANPTGGPTTIRIVPRSSATWTNPNNTSTTVDLYQTGYYNGTTAQKRLNSAPGATPSVSSYYQYPIGEDNNYITYPATHTPPNVPSAGDIDFAPFTTAFYHPNGKIYYLGANSKYVFYHRIGSGDWGTNKELLSKASLTIPIFANPSRVIYNSIFEKPLDTVSTNIGIVNTNYTFDCYDSDYTTGFNTTFTPSIVSGFQNIPNTIQLGSDQGSNYNTSTWITGSNLGTNFEPWDFIKPSGITTAIESPAIAGIATTGIGTSAFSIKSTGTSFGFFSRDLVNGLNVGEALSFYLGINGNAGTNGNKGVAFKSNGNTILSITNGNSDTILLQTLNNGNIVIDSDPGTNPMFVTLSRIGYLEYKVTVTKRSNPGQLFEQVVNNIEVIDNITFFIGNQQSAVANKNLYFNHLEKYEYFTTGKYQEVDVQLGIEYKIKASSHTDFIYITSTDVSTVYSKGIGGSQGLSFKATSNATVKVFVYSDALCTSDGAPRSLEISQEEAVAFTVIDSTTIEFKLDFKNVNSVKIFNNMLLESSDFSFVGTPYVSARTVAANSVTIQVKNKENSLPYDPLNPPRLGDSLIAKQDMTRLKVYLYITYMATPNLSNQQSLGVFVFDPVTESVTHLSNTIGGSGSTATSYPAPIYLPNGKHLAFRTGASTNVRGNIIDTGTDKNFITNSVYNYALAQSAIVGIPGKYTIPGVVPNTGLSTASSIPIFGPVPGKTFILGAGGTGILAGEFIATKGYGPGIKYYNVTSEQIEYATIPKTPTGDFDAANFSSSYYNMIYNRPGH